MQMPGRKYRQSSSNYRYGFNGKENDNDVKGDGNQQDYGMRIFDTRIGRFLSTDPLINEYPWNSPYAYAENDPINYEDIDGMEKPDAPAAARRVIDRGALRPNPSLKSTTRVDRNGKVIVAPISPSNPPTVGPYQGITRVKGGWYVENPNGGEFVGDKNPHGPQPPKVPVDLRTPEKKQFDANVDNAQRGLYNQKKDICVEKETPLVLPEVGKVPVRSPASEVSNTNNEKPRLYLVRRGENAESAEKLQSDATNAEQNPRFGHGVSTSLKSRISGTDKNNRSALVSDVAKIFTVKPTPTLSDPNHVTVILPKPVTKEVEAKFNSLFKKKN